MRGLQLFLLGTTLASLSIEERNAYSADVGLWYDSSLEDHDEQESEIGVNDSRVQTQAVTLQQLISTLRNAMGPDDNVQHTARHKSFPDSAVAGQADRGHEERSLRKDGRVRGFPYAGPQSEAVLVGPQNKGLDASTSTGHNSRGDAYFAPQQLSPGPTAEHKNGRDSLHTIASAGDLANKPPAHVSALAELSPAATQVFHGHDFILDSALVARSASASGACGGVAELASASIRSSSCANLGFSFKPRECGEMDMDMIACRSANAGCKTVCACLEPGVYAGRVEEFEQHIQHLTDHMFAKEECVKFSDDDFTMVPPKASSILQASFGIEHGDPEAEEKGTHSKGLLSAKRQDEEKEKERLEAEIREEEERRNAPQTARRYILWAACFIVWVAMLWTLLWWFGC